MIEFQENKISAVHSAIRHGFFGRRGGVGSGLYDSLNCAFSSRDDPLTVQKNRSLVASQLIENEKEIQTTSQIHSADCHYINASIGSGNRPEGDAFVTDKPNLVIGVLTADCGPVLFAGVKADGSPIIGAAHAGWGGALKGICEETIITMLDHGAVLKTLVAVIGPCIAPESYEISKGFEKPFLDQDAGNEQFFLRGSKEDKLMFDLPAYIASRITKAGVNNVNISGIDTFANEERFFSYRRTTHRQEADYGRQVSAIAIAE
ncbi:MAG: peptidoglycan editing factor PgeF [Pseudomonadota bacterium]